MEKFHKWLVLLMEGTDTVLPQLQLQYIVNKNIPKIHVISLIILVHDFKSTFCFATPYNSLSPSGYRQQHLWNSEANVTSPFLYFRLSIIFPSPIRVSLLFNSCSSYLETAFGLNDHLQLKDFEILR